MKTTRFLACLAILVGATLHHSFVRASSAQQLDINIQMVPGLWITGGSGPVNIQYTTNLNQTNAWSILATVQVTNGPYFYVDVTATNAPKRFYRAMIETQSPVNPDPQHLVWIAPGTFTMGSPDTEQDRQAYEGPQTVVTLTKGYWMSKYETTQAEYQSVIGSNPSWYTGDLQRPVEQVTWLDATNYCWKLTERERTAGRLPAGYEYRLPTEAEWEYACRAGTTTRFSYGDDPDYSQLGQYAWYLSNSSSSTHAVGGKKPNAWGLYDMHGNVWEWCLDLWGTYPGGSVTNPTGATSGSDRVSRPGCWQSPGPACRSAFHGRGKPAYRVSDLGFRTVLAQLP